MLIKKSLIKLNQNNNIAIVILAFSYNESLSNDLLTHDEKKFFSNISYSKRIYEYYFGRLVAKNALQLLEPSLKYKDITILRKNNGVPIFKINKKKICSSIWNLSISHSNGIAAAIVTNNDISCGIDVEFWNQNKINAFKRLSPSYNNSNSLLALWSLKESLVKALKTGFIEKFSQYRSKNFQIKNGLAKCCFENYKNYNGLAYIYKDRVISIVLDKNNYIPYKKLQNIWINL